MKLTKEEAKFLKKILKSTMKMVISEKGSNYSEAMIIEKAIKELKL